ncbi:hypothetical protein D9M68_841710 [compost metagenome]
MTFLFQALGVLEHGPADVVADIGQLVRFAELHVSDPEWRNVVELPCKRLDQASLGSV